MIDVDYIHDETLPYLFYAIFAKAFLGINYYRKKRSGEPIGTPKENPFGWALFMSPKNHIFTGKLKIIHYITISIDLIWKTLMFINFTLHAFVIFRIL